MNKLEGKTEGELQLYQVYNAINKYACLLYTSIPQKETLDNVEAVLQAIMRDFPLTHINLISVLPVSRDERYKQKVYVRTNEKIQALNQAYRELAQAYHQVSYIDVYSSLLDEEGQLAEAYTTDGLHLSVAGYRILAQALQETLYRKRL